MHDWDRTYAEFDEGQLDAPWATLELAGVLAALDPRPMVALDVGCGTGGDAVYLAQQGIATIGVDPSERALQLARTRAERAGVTVAWVVGDATSLPVDDASVDLVTDRGCLHHVPIADQPTYAREVARVLRPGGVFVVRDMTQGHHSGRHDPDATVRSMVEGTALALTSVAAFRHGPMSGVVAVVRRSE